MFCSNCGTQINEGEKFCSGCGTAVANSNQSPAQPTAQQVNQNPAPVAQPTVQKKPKKNGKKIGGIVMAVFGALSLIGLDSASRAMLTNYELGARIIISIALVISGVWLIYASKPKK